MRSAKSSCAKSCRCNWDRVERRLAEKRIELDFDKAAVDWLGEKGFDPVYGARPLKRVIQSAVLNPLAKNVCSRA